MVVKVMMLMMSKYAYVNDYADKNYFDESGVGNDGASTRRASYLERVNTGARRSSTQVGILELNVIVFILEHIVIIFIQEHNVIILILEHNGTIFILEHNVIIFILEQNVIIFILEHNVIIFILEHRFWFNSLPLFLLQGCQF